MARTVHKWQLGPGINQLYGEFPANGPVHVGEQYGGLCLWAEIDPDKHRTTQKVVEVFGTGHPVPNDRKYIGTAVCHNGALVWHIYEVI